MKRVCITGADRGLGLSMVKLLLMKDYQVIAGQYMTSWPDLDRLKEKYKEQLILLPLDVSSDESVKAFGAAVRNIGPVDLLINDAGIIVGFPPVVEDRNYENMMKCFDVNALGGIRVTLELLDSLRQGNDKRLCYISSEAGSIGECWREGEIGYCMSKAALNMGVRILYNALSKEGFSFKLYHPGWMKSFMKGEKDLSADLEPDEAAEKAIDYFLSDQNTDELKLYSYDGKVYEW